MTHFLDSNRLTKYFAIVLFIFAPSLIIQSQNASLEIVSTNSEIEYLKTRLSDWYKSGGINEYPVILVIMPNNTRFIGTEDFYKDNNRYYKYDNSVLASSKNPVSIPWMVHAVLKEMEIKKSYNLIDCGFNTKDCIQSNLVNANNIIVTYAYGKNATHGKSVEIASKPYVINLSEMTSNPIQPIIKVIDLPNISATSILNNFGPGGLLSAQEPGWHAEYKPAYPQSIQIDFKKIINFSKIIFTPQGLNFNDRSPKKVDVLVSSNKEEWRTVARLDNICLTNSKSNSYQHNFNKTIIGRYLKIIIIDNCGHPELLTLKGLHVD